MLCRSVGKIEISLVALLLMLLSSALAGTLLVRLVTANPNPIPGDGIYQPPIYHQYSVESPQHTTYNTRTVPFILVVKTSSFSTHHRYYYILDGRGDLRVDDVRVDLVPVKETVRTVVSSTCYTYAERTLEFNVVLSNLSDGSHNIIFGEAPLVGSGWDNPYVSDLTPDIYFSVKIVAPKVTVLSPKNETYDVALAPLNFRINSAVSWVGYSLDDKGNVTVSGDALVPHFLNDNLLFLEGTSPLSGLSDGVYRVTVYAEDFDGNIGVSSCVFTVDQEGESTPEPFPPILIAVVIVVSVAIVGFGLLAYFAKRNRRRSK